MKPDSILYYPHIEFQNEAWVKSCLLLWNHVYRIVPEGYTPMIVMKLKHLLMQTWLEILNWMTRIERILLMNF